MFVQSTKKYFFLYLVYFCAYFSASKIFSEGNICIYGLNLRLLQKPEKKLAKMTFVLMQKSPF
jgi:hypothetical protein